MLGGTLGAPILIRRVGHVKAFPAFVTLAVVATMLLPLRVEPAVWVALRAATGFAFAGIFAVTESWINARARNADRGRIYAVYQLVNFVAGTLGQWSLGALQIGGAAAFLAGGALIAASVVPLLASHAQSPPAPRSIRPRPLWIARLAPVSAFASLVAGIANGSVWALGPLYAVGIGVPATDVPAFTSAIIVGSAAGVFPAGLLSDRIDRRLAPAFEMGVGAVAEFALSMLHAPGAAMIVLGFMVGATTFTCYTISMSHAADRARGQEFVAVSTSMLAIYCFGAISGPALGSMAMRCSDRPRFSPKTQRLTPP